MIVASLLLVIAAAVTLLLGLLNRQDIQWVWASIACCLLAGLLLTIGVLRSRPSRKPVLQSGGDGAAASWAGASNWGGNSGESSSAVLTRDDDESAEDETTQVGGGPELQGDDEPTRTDMPAPAPTPEEESATSPWAPTAGDDDTGDDGTGDDDTGDVRLIKAESPAAPEPFAPEPVAEQPVDEPARAEEPGAAEPTAVDDDVIVVPKPSARGGLSAEDAVAGQTAGAGQVGATARRGAATGTDDAARFEQVLSPIAGVGAAKRAALYQHFGTYRKLRAASPEKLAEVPGISRTLADRIYTALHSK